MDLTVLENSKDEIKIELNSLTLVEILRVYLNKDPSVTFVAWNREHPSKNPVLAVKTKGKTAKKAINDAVAVLEKDLDKVVGEFKKLK
ncbi:MAG TPA: RpoL/Rpb11 RNA polymerase subunit family protein [Candidatus Nanoarchaeia archaeon]|nr:RpoL/Rpb11 RNA polymerase subunit family protein [Candidatus Nanoarchaeia archaeon]